MKFTQTWRGIGGRRFVVALLVLLLPPAWADPVELPFYEGAVEVGAACDGMLEELARREKALESQTDLDSRKLLPLWNDLFRQEQALGYFNMLAMVHPSDPIRESSRRCNRRAAQAMSDSVWKNDKLLAPLLSMRAADATDQRYRDRLLRLLREFGTVVDAEQRAGLRQLLQETHNIGGTYVRRIQRDATTIELSQSELEGVHPGLWQDAPRDENGVLRLPAKGAIASLILESAVAESTREKVWRGMQKVGVPDNLQTLDQLARQRLQLARLAGEPSFAAYAFHSSDRMASLAQAQAFLSDLKRAAQARELVELKALRLAKARETGVAPDTVELHPWDISYYVEKLQPRGRFDRWAARPFLPSDRALPFAFLLAKRLLGVEFVPIQTSGAWHPSVTAYEVIDSASRAKLGRLLADLQDRPDKYSRGAVWHLQRADASQTPMAALVLALPAEGGLTLDDLAGVLHCFADAMKVILGRSRYVAPANDAIDITTALGLMFEEWAYDPTVLALYREVCKSCERIPDSLLAEGKARRPWASGRSMARQVLYAQYDLALHGERLERAQALWDGLARDAVLGGATGETIPARFEHPVDFPAGYYSYLWNAMVAADLNTAFRGKQLSAEVGRRLRDLVLSDGEQIPPGGAFAKFLGRAPNSKAFLALQTP